MARTRVVHPPDRRELAFRVWRECGQSATVTLRKLAQEYDWPNLTRGALYDWISQHDWNGRAARLQAEEERAEVAKLMGREKILADLTTRKGSYERYLEQIEAKGGVDNAATTAYANLCKTIMQLQDKIEGGAGLSKLDLAKDMLRQQFAFVRESYPDHAAAFLEVMEPFSDRLVDLYGG